MNSTPALLLKYLVLDVVFDVLKFPLWWYTRGTNHAWNWYRTAVRDAMDGLALIILMKNLGRPMFGDYTKEGRAISFGVRIVQLIVSWIIFLVWWAILTVLLMLWWASLPLIVGFILYAIANG